MSDDRTRWLVRGGAAAHGAIRLFCLPYAGGSTRTFRPWSALMPACVEVCGIELPGRLAHFTTPPLRDLPALLDALEDALEPVMDRPFALFGHSMGGMIAYELAHRLDASGRQQPAHLFVSGWSAPHLSPDPETVPPRDDPSVLHELVRLNDGVRALLDRPELVALLLPMLRADFAMCDAYRYAPRPPLTCPVTVFGATRDTEAPAGTLQAWAPYTTGGLSLHITDGDHLFVDTRAPWITQQIWIALRTRGLDAS